MLNFLRDRSSFKPEINESRNTPTPSVCSLPEVAITETEQKLIRLGLNSAASQGESDNCAVKLFQSLRRRGVNAEQIISSFTQQTWAMRELAAARGYVVNFGQYRGKTVGEVPHLYQPPDLVRPYWRDNEPCES